MGPIFADDEEDPNSPAPPDFGITDPDINDKIPEDHDAGLSERWREVVEIAKERSPDLKVKHNDGPWQVLAFISLPRFPHSSLSLS